MYTSYEKTCNHYNPIAKKAQEIVDDCMKPVIAKLEKACQDKKEQDNRWKELSSDSRYYYIKEYKKLQRLIKENAENSKELETVMKFLVDTFGENIVKESERKVYIFSDFKSPGIEIKDYENFVELKIFKRIFDYTFIDRIIAALKIRQLIDIAYGGLFTNKEKKDTNLMKHVICYSLEHEEISHIETCHWQESYIAFRTDEHLQEFIRHKENISLLEQYFCGKIKNC